MSSGSVINMGDAGCNVTTKNPRETASVLSLITFWWMSDILSLGSKQALREEDLFPIETTSRTETIVSDLERKWLEEARSFEEGGSKPRLWRAMLKMTPFREFIFVASLRVVYSLASSFLPLMLWFLLQSLSTESTYKSTLPFVVGIALMSIAKSLSHRFALFNIELILVRLKAALIGVVYKKILNLTRHGLETTISGNIIDLVSNDVQAIEQLGYALLMFSFALLDIILSVALVWYLIGWQALVGTSFFLLVAVYGSTVTRTVGKVRKKAAALTDQRLEIMKEIVSGIRVVKMCAWELNFKDLVSRIRKKEISLIRIRCFIVSSVYSLLFTSAAIAGFISITTLLLTGNQLTSFEIFTVLFTLANIKFAITVSLADSLRLITEAGIACDRIQKFIEDSSPKRRNGDDTCPKPRNGEDSTECEGNGALSHVKFKGGRKFKSQVIRLESFRTGKPTLIGVHRLEESSRETEPHLLIENMSCSWNHKSECSTLQDVSFIAKPGKLVGITGPVGSGKTSLLMSILGELPVSLGKITCIGNIAYVPQIPWVFSGTVRDNVVFGRPLTENLYRAVIKVCDLKSDIESFPKGDLTEIGQHGISLSGGQRARVSLARAIYTQADIYLLDDPLSAVDARVGRHLFNSCIKGFLTGRTRILVTHQLKFLRESDCTIVLQNGSVVYQGAYSDINSKAMATKLPCNINEEEQTTFLFETKSEFEVRDEESDVNIAVSNQVYKAVTDGGNELNERVDLTEDQEDKMTGTVKWRLYWRFFRAALPSPLIVCLVVFLVMVQVCWISPYFWMARMAQMTYEQQKSSVTIAVFGSLVVGSFLLTLLSAFLFNAANLRSSENLHNKMTMAVMKAPVLFFDTNPVGRILNRFSKDIGCMDYLLPEQFLMAVQLWLHFFSATLLSSVANVWLFIACVPMILIFAYLGMYYMKSAREIRRLEAVTCSPVYSHITCTIAGLEVIRSSNMQDSFLQQLYKYQDKNSSALMMVNAARNWVSLRADLIAIFLVTSVAAAASIVTQNPAFVGMSLTFVADTLDYSQYGILMASETENRMTSVERVFTYTEIDPEPGYNTETLPPESWPAEGSLTLQDLSLAYLRGAPTVVKDMNFCIAHKEKVGVVGRTGAGKSSLVAALFRMPEPNGKILIDGVNIKDLNLPAARRSMTVIAQDPVLFGGSLRRNLDPFSRYEDHDLWRALEDVQMRHMVEKLPGLLEYKLRESGSNFSVGERQLVCLARALLQRGKIIILDEATAHVDFKTDSLIQKVIRNKFQDFTVVTIAHRLNTVIDYDKVLVLDQGRVVEFDKPRILLQNKEGYFTRLVQSHNTTAGQ